MQSQAGLLDSALETKFLSEEKLEEFVWQNLASLLDLQSLHKQFYVDRNYCDILAVNQDSELVIIELKNTEDRYVVSQLVRYYDALLSHKPSSDLVDYSKRVHLIEIAPSFHRDNLVDQKYCQLDVRLLRFSINQEADGTYFELLDEQDKKINKIPISFAIPSTQHVIPEASRAFKNFVSKLIQDDQEFVYELRERILSLDSKIKEETKSSYFAYGRGKNLICAGIGGRSSTYGQKKALHGEISLWLPTNVRSSGEPRIGRLVVSNSIYPIQSISTLDHTELLYVPVGTKRKSYHRNWGIQQYIWLYLERRYYPEANYSDAFEVMEKYIEEVLKVNIPQDQFRPLNFLIELSFFYWRQRASKSC